jgi:hypothetical protein
LKVAGTRGPPSEWPAILIDKQRTACIAAFRQEIAQLRNSLIVVTSANAYGILDTAVVGDFEWDRQARESDTAWGHDPLSGNTYVHCDHPKFMSLKRRFEAAVLDVIGLAQETLPPFDA